MKIAYFINQYPKVSHSFIRREILALEGLGLDVKRFALRGWDDGSLVDPEDVAEQARTKFVLQGSKTVLVAFGVCFAVLNPVQVWKGLRLALSLARGGDRTIAHHLVSLLDACAIGCGERVLRMCTHTSEPTRLKSSCCHALWAAQDSASLPTAVTNGTCQPNSRFGRRSNMPDSWWV